MVQERNGSTAVLREYTWGLHLGGGIGGLLNLKQDGQNYAYLYDGKGNVEAILDSAQNVVAAYRYDLFGNVIAKTGVLEQPFQFSTKRYNAPVGIVQSEFRNYFPDIGRWDRRDPIDETGGLNLYAFVGNNPVNWVDPWGLKRICTAEKQRFFEWLYKDLHQMANDLNTQEDFLLTLATKEGGWTSDHLDHNQPLNNPFGVNTIENGQAAGNKSYDTLTEATQEWISMFGDRVRDTQTLQDFIDGLQCKDASCNKYNSATSGYEDMFKKVYESVSGYKAACQDVIDEIMKGGKCE